MTKFGIPLAVLTAVLVCAPARAAIVGGGGSKTTDCMMVFDADGANKPAPPKAPKLIDCTDGDPACDTDGERNGVCVFDLSICLNDSSFDRCTPEETETVEIEHAEDNGDPRFDVDWQALQVRVDGLGLPNDFTDDCTTVSTVSVRLRGPLANQKMKKQKKILRTTSEGSVAAGTARDRDKMKFFCRPEGNGIYAPRDLFSSTYDRLAQQVFAGGCALSACHDSESQAGGLVLLPNAAHGNIVNVTPTNIAAANDSLKRITPADPVASFLYRKITGDLEPGYGSKMPLTGADVSPELTEIMRLWILGDGTTGPASATGWVDGTDQ